MHSRVGKVLVFTLACAAVSCGKKNGSLGEPVSDAEVGAVSGYEGVVSIGGGSLCTGTVIAKRAVLTASHCVKNLSTVTVRLPAGLMKPQKIEALGSSELGSSGDVAVLIFDKDVATQDVSSSIKEHVDAGEEVTLVGFGCNAFEARTGQGVKRAGTNRITATGEFLEIVTPVGKDSKRILGPKNYAGSCFGDSGGPMLQRGGVVGIDHSAGGNDREHLSRYVNLTEPSKLGFLKRISDAYSLGVTFEP